MDQIARSRSNSLRLLSSLFTFAAKAHAVPIGFNPCRAIEYFPEESREPYLTTSELARIGEAIREAETIGLPCAVDQSKPKAKHARRTIIGPRAAAALRLLIFAGARLREILHLKWDHIDFDRGLSGLPRACEIGSRGRASPGGHQPSQPQSSRPCPI
jgi:integrase